MDDGFLRQSVEGLDDPTFMKTSGGTWNRLQGLKEDVSQDLLSEGPLCESASDGLRENETSASNVRELEWHHRQHLETRLRAVTEAQDRLMEGTYGKCVECGRQIHAGRLAADPAVSLCLKCQRIAEGEQSFRTM